MSARRRFFDAEKRAVAVREAQANIETTIRAVKNRYDENDPATRAWKSAVAAFHRAIDDAYPPGFWEAFENYRTGCADDRELLLQFLEADAMFFRSGYIKARVAQRLKKETFSPTDRARVQRVVLNLVERRASQEFRRYLRLAHAVDDETLRAELAALINGADRMIALRARWMRDYLVARTPKTAH